MVAPQTVTLNNMNGLSLTTDVVHPDGLSLSWPVASLPYGMAPNGLTNYTSAQVICPNPTCGTVSFYPMAGGYNAQYLHYLKLMALSNSEVQAVASARGLTTTGSQAMTATLILMNECNVQGVQYFGLQGHS
jgi:hypothetical protein